MGISHYIVNSFIYSKGIFPGTMKFFLILFIGLILIRIANLFKVFINRKLFFQPEVCICRVLKELVEYENRLILSGVLE